MRPMIVVWIAAVMALAGCNTIQGVGKDIEKAGESIQRATK